MVKSNLKIFDPIREYLIAAVQNCPSGFDACPNKDILRKFFEQQYYRSNPNNLVNTDIPREFTKRVLQLALNLNALDRSSTQGTLLGSLLNTADSYANRYADLQGGIPKIINLEQTTQVGGAPFVSTKLVGSYSDNYLKGLTSEIKKAYNQFGGFRKTNKEIIGNIDELNVLLHNDIKQQIINSLEKRYYKNYLTGGNSDDVKPVLRALSKGEVDAEDLMLFNTFIMVMELSSGDVSDPNKEWRWMGDVRLDGFKLLEGNEYRLNLKRVDLKVPTTYSSTGFPSVPGPMGNNDPVNLVKGMTPFLISRFIPYSLGGEIEDPDGVKHSDPYWLVNEFNKYISPQNKLQFNPSYDLTTTGRLADKLNCDEIIRKEISKTKMDNEEMFMDDPYKTNPAINKNGWVKLDNGDYEKKLGDGTRFVYKKDETEYNKLFTSANRCFSSQLDIGHDDCCKMMNEVLKGNSEELINFVNNHSFSYLVDPKNINEAHPLLVLKVLKSFGFREELVYDMAVPGGYNGKIWKIQTVDKWKTKYLDKKFTPTQISSIMNKLDLLQYLRLLVDYVNANPSLINEGLVKSTGVNKQEIQVPEEFLKRGVIPCIYPTKKNKFSTDWSELSKNINNIYGDFYKGLNFKSHLPFGMNNLFPYTQTWGLGHVFRGTTLYGGAKPEVILDVKETVPQFTHQVAKEINTLLERLNSLNKPLRKSDLDRIQQKLQDFSRLETELHNTILMINKYTQLASIFNKDGSREIVSESSIHNYVNRYQPLVDKYENTKTGLEGLLTILKEINDEDDDDVKVSVLQTRPISV